MKMDYAMCAMYFKKWMTWFLYVVNVICIVIHYLITLREWDDDQM